MSRRFSNRRLTDSFYRVTGATPTDHRTDPPVAPEVRVGGRRRSYHRRTTPPQHPLPAVSNSQVIREQTHQTVRPATLCPGSGRAGTPLTCCTASVSDSCCCTSGYLRVRQTVSNTAHSVVALTTTEFGNTVPVTAASKLATSVRLIAAVTLIPWLVVRAGETGEVDAECGRCQNARHYSDANYCWRCGKEAEGWRIERTNCRGG
jgi:hypothetical protein